MLTKEIKLGRPPLGDRPLTPAQIKARYRAKQRATRASRVFDLTIRGEMKRKVEEIAKNLDLPAARVLRLCLEAGLGDMWLTSLAVRDRIDRDPASRRVRNMLWDIKRQAAQAGVPTPYIDGVLKGKPLGSVEEAALDVLVSDDDLKHSLEGFGQDLQGLDKALGDWLDAAETEKGGEGAK